MASLRNCCHSKWSVRVPQQRVGRFHCKHETVYASAYYYIRRAPAALPRAVDAGKRAANLILLFPLFVMCVLTLPAGCWVRLDVLPERN